MFEQFTYHRIVKQSCAKSFVSLKGSRQNVFEMLAYKGGLFNKTFFFINYIWP